MNADLVGYIKLGIGAGIIGGVVTATLMTPEFDDDNCLVGGPITGHQLIIYDTSEAEDGGVLTQVLQDVFAGITREERLSVYRIADPVSEKPHGKHWPLVELFSKCSPGSAKEAAPLIEGRQVMERRHRITFKNPLEEAVSARTAQTGGRSSPLLGALAQVVSIRHFDADTSNRRLIVVSDFLEHHPNGYSHIGLWSGGWRDAIADPSVNVTGTADLTGVDIAICYVDRKRYPGRQSERHRAFWESYFRDAGVNSPFPTAIPLSACGTRLSRPPVADPAA